MSGDRIADKTRSVRLTRRQVASTLAAAVMTAGAFGCSSRSSEKLAASLAALEARSGGRLGVCVHDPESGSLAGYRLDERFGMCSTFKMALAALILREIDHGRLAADQAVSFSREDLVPYAPVTSEFLDVGSMPVIELAKAAQTTSDNVAANLLLRLIDGPAGFTAALRSIGDRETRLDRYEPELNFVPAGEVRDTTTPAAMAKTAARLVLGDVLSRESRSTLFGWMRETGTGLARIRAGLPADWIAGDKTGTGIADGMPNKYNDIAVAMPGSSASVSITAYYDAAGSYDEIRAIDEAVLADAGRLVASHTG